MMLQPHAFSYPRCREEVREFQVFLGVRTALRERDEILPFFQARKHLSAFLGVHEPQVIVYDRVAHEYPLFGDFTCDLVVGDWARRAYVFVEFENAAPNSVFVQRGRSTPEWSPWFERGMSQILDWFYKLDSQRHTADFEGRFGGRSIHASGLLVVGRREDLGPREQERLKWRRQHVSINGHQVHSLTFDDLCESLLLRLSGFPLLFETPDSTPGT